MTVDSTNPAIEHVCNGVTTSFSFPFVVYADEDLFVRISDKAVETWDGSEVTVELVNGTDFTIDYTDADVNGLQEDTLLWASRKK